MNKMILVFGILLLFLPSVASADGWVLWLEREFYYEPLRKETTWELKESYPTHGECGMWAKAGVTAFKEIADEKLTSLVSAKIISDTELCLTYNKNDQTYLPGRTPVGICIKFKCLPGTIDPRK